QVLASVPGNSATVLVALAAIGGRPARTSVGKVMNEPPPATAFIVPASKPAAISNNTWVMRERSAHRPCLAMREHYGAGRTMGSTFAGTFRSRSSSHATALPSDGARQSPRGEREPPALTFGPFGIALRLNWLKAKKRRKNTSIHCLISARPYAFRRSGGKCGGQSPCPASSHACSAMKAILDGRNPYRSV